LTIADTTLPSGTRLSFREVGRGRPVSLVQIHGLGTGHRNYDLLTPHLGKKLHVLDIDLPGYGRSDPGPYPPTIAGFAEHAAQFIESADLAPVHVHGTSMGGCVAMMLASRRPELVDRLVVTCSFARLDRAAQVMFATWREAANYGGIPALARVTSQQGFSRSFWDRPESRDTQDAFVAALEGTSPQGFLRDLGAIESLDLSVEAADIAAPTLLLGADEDIITPMKAAPSGRGMLDLHALIPGSVLKTFPECGHFISIERPEDTAAQIIDFLLAPRP